MAEFNQETTASRHAELARNTEIDDTGLQKMISLRKVWDEQYKFHPLDKIPGDWGVWKERFIDTLLEDPRGIAFLPEQLTKQFYRNKYPQMETFWRDYERNIDLGIMRRQVEPIMYDLPFKVDPLRKAAFNLYAKYKKLPSLYGPEDVDFEGYFENKNPVYPARMELRSVLAERNKHLDSMTPEKDRYFQIKMADAVAKAPEVIEEVPAEIKDDLQPINFFYERLAEQWDKLEEHKEAYREKMASGEKMDLGDKFSIQLSEPVQKYIEDSEKYARLELERIERDFAKLNNQNNLVQGYSVPEVESNHIDTFEVPSAEDPSAFYEEDYIPTQEELMGNDYSAKQMEEMQEYYANNIPMPDEAPDLENPPIQEYGLEYDAIDSYYPKNYEQIWDGVPELDEKNMSSLFESMEKAKEELPEVDYEFDLPTGSEFDVDYTVDSDYGNAFGSDPNKDKLDELAADWYDLGLNQNLNPKEAKELKEIETEMGELIAQSPHLYMDIPMELIGLSGVQNDFFESLIKNSEKQGGIFDSILEEDVDKYKRTKPMHLYEDSKGASEVKFEESKQENDKKSRNVEMDER